MKRRILAIVLVLMLAVSLLPVTAAAEENYAFICVNGVTFTSIDQVIPCGEGTASLLFFPSSGSYELNLVNATIDKFADVGTQDGVTCYAGIVFQGNVKLQICTYGNTTINAPQHDGSKYYEGVLADGNVSFTEYSIDGYGDGAFNFNGVDCGINSLSGNVGMSVSRMNINASDVGIVCDKLSKSGTELYVNCTGNVGIAANTVNSGCTIVVNLTPDVRKGYSDCYGMIVENYNLTDWSSYKVNRFTVNYDGSGYKGTEPITVCGVSASNITAEDGNHISVEAIMNVSCTKNVYVVGISAETCKPFEIKCDLKLKGQHGESIGLYAEELRLPHRLVATVSGAAQGDLAVMAGSLKSNYSFDLICAETDCAAPELGAIYVENGIPESMFCKFNMFEPSFGGIISLTEDGKNSIALDADGNPARVLLIRRNATYPFTDIEGNSLAPYKDATVWAFENGITTGTDPITFSPNLTCTREQIVTFLWRAMGCPEPATTKNPFKDVASTGLGAPYYKAILWAYENGITSGTDARHFSPKQVCTRSQAVTFLWRAVGSPEPESSRNIFWDVPQGSFYYKPALWAVEKGITNGTDGKGVTYITGTKTFSPDAVCTRCQIVTFIYRGRDDIVKIADAPKAVSAVIRSDTEQADSRHTLKFYLPDKTQYYCSCPFNVEVGFSDGSTCLYAVNVYNTDELLPDGLAEVIAVRNGKVFIEIKDNGTAGGKDYVVAFDTQAMKLETVLYAAEVWMSAEDNYLIGSSDYCTGTQSSSKLAPKQYSEKKYTFYDFDSGTSYTKNYKNYDSYLADDGNGIYYSRFAYNSEDGLNHCFGCYLDFDTQEETVLFDASYATSRDKVCFADETGFTLTYIFYDGTQDVTTVRRFDLAGTEITAQ